MSIEEKLKRLDELNARAMVGGGGIERQHAASSSPRASASRFALTGQLLRDPVFVVHRCTDFGME